MSLKDFPERPSPKINVQVVEVCYVARLDIARTKVIENRRLRRIGISEPNPSANRSSSRVPIIRRVAEADEHSLLFLYLVRRPSAARYRFVETAKMTFLLKRT